MTSSNSLTSVPLNCWTYLTHSRVTWRQASEGSLFLFALSAATGALVVVVREFRRARA